MRSSLGGVLSATLLLGVVAADILEGSFNFGHRETLSQNQQGVPGWKLDGEPHPPQVLSDRIVLTPPWPGNRRGALWTEQRLQKSEFTADLEFRASGPERGGGNLQLWYTKGTLGSSSVYTVGKFDGLVIVVDTYGGRGGSIRGFLNDGSTDYKAYRNIDSLAFGHCSYPYRNLGRLTKLQIKHRDGSFEVNVDDKPCFGTKQVKLPPDHHFGISAGSADIPDSFEANKFIVLTPNEHKKDSGGGGGGVGGSVPINVKQVKHTTPNQGAGVMDKAQLDELHKRLQSLTQQMDHLRSLAQDLEAKASRRHQDLLDRTASMESLLRATLPKNTHSDSTTTTTTTMNDLPSQLRQLQDALEKSHSNLLLTHLPHSLSQGLSSSVLAASTITPRSTSLFLAAILLVQILSVAAFVAYKFRRANSLKKYL